MLSLKDTLFSAESKVGIPIMAKEYDELGEDIKEYAEKVWVELADWALADFATKIHLDITYRSPIEQKMYFALQRKYISYFINYQNTAKLLIGKKLSDISAFLKQQKQSPIYDPHDIDYEIDLFLYLNCFIISGHSLAKLNMPFFIAIECDGHEFHEKTKEQAQKDKSKDRFLSSKGLAVFRFTGSEITKNPDKCADEIDSMLDKHLNSLKDLMDRLKV